LAAKGEVLTAPARPVEAVVAAVASGGNCVEQMSRGGFGDGAVVGLDPRQALDLRAALTSTAGSPTHDHVAHALVLDPRDDTVAAPAPQPFRRIVAASVFAEVDRPALVLAHVRDDPV
jgi:hypothetical protein